MKFEPRPADHSVNVTARHPLADAAVLVLGLGAVLLLVTIVLAFFADALVARISVKTEMRWFGGMSLPAVVDEFETTSASEEQALEDLLARLTQHWESDYTFRLRISENTAPNALAFPGGLIVVTRGLLDNVESENELAFVLAHELGHFRNRDHLRGSVRKQDSSPPNRATVSCFRTDSRRRFAVAISAWSPASWPRVSFTRLN